MKLETAVFTRPTNEWVTRQVVVFDWHDGPREGIVWLDSPDCEFYFQLLAEKPTQDDLDDRLFRISEIPHGTVSNVLHAIRVLGEPSNNVWIPVWRFASDHDRHVAEAVIHENVNKKRETDLVIWTRDMKEFLGCWHSERNGTPESWFTKLGIVQ